MARSKACGAVVGTCTIVHLPSVWVCNPFRSRRQGLSPHSKLRTAPLRCCFGHGLQMWGAAKLFPHGHARTATWQALHLLNNFSCASRRNTNQHKMVSEAELSTDPDNIPPRSRLFVVVPKQADAQQIQVRMARSGGRWFEGYAPIQVVLLPVSTQKPDCESP